RAGFLPARRQAVRRDRADPAARRRGLSATMAIPGWATLSQAARDAAYNNNLAVANSAELIERRNAASAVFRKQHPAGLDVPYGPAPRQRFDLFAANNAAAPCLVLIHGGYWQRNTREDFAAFAEGIMAHGWSAAMVGYTLAPDVDRKSTRLNSSHR